MAPSKSNGKLPVSYRPIKARTENWTTVEKLYLIELCGERLNVIEDRRTDTMSVALKARTWDEIHTEFSRRFVESQREMRRIREQWKRLKVYVRVEVQKHLRQKEEEEFLATNGQVKTASDPVATADLPENGYGDEGGGSSGELNPVVERMLSIVPCLANGLSTATVNLIGEGDEEDDSFLMGSSMYPHEQQPAVICDINLGDSNEGSGGHAALPNEDMSPDLNLKVTGSYSLKRGDHFLNGEVPPTNSRESCPTRRSRRKRPQRSRFTVRRVRTTTTTPTSAASANGVDYERLKQERQLAMLEEEHCATMEIIAIRKQVALLEKRIALKRLAAMDR